MFKTPLELREHTTPDFWVVIDELIWETDTPAERIVVPRGFLTDLASIPQILRNVFDPDGLSRSPAVLHDWLYRTHQFSREVSDNHLYAALTSRGMSLLTAHEYLEGVRLGGGSSYTCHPNGPQASDFASVDFYNAWKLAAAS